MRDMCAKITTSLTCLSIVNGLVIFCQHISHLMDINTTDVVSFNTKYFIPRTFFTLSLNLQLIWMKIQILSAKCNQNII